MTVPKRNMNSSNVSLFYFLFLFLFCSNTIYARAQEMNSEQKLLSVPIGVILDLNSTFGTMVNLCMDMAISDFYSSHLNYTTRLQLHKKDAKSVLDVNFAVLELVKHEEVLAIFGPQGSIEETYAAAFGETHRVPIVSFTARSTSLSYTQNQYFVRTTLDDAVQAQALADICKRFEWHEVVVFYEDTEYGKHFLNHLIKVFQDVDIGLIYMISISTSTEDNHILKEFNRTQAKQTRVYLVHMSPVLGSRLFTLADSAGMMSEGYAWIITDSLSIFLNSIYTKARDSMDGVLGVRPYVLPSKNLESFKENWKRNPLLNKNTDQLMEMNIYGLWAYDAVTALAVAVENIRPVNSSSLHVNVTDKTGLRISSYGPKLINELSNMKFTGLAGDFQLVEGKLKSSAFEIFNIIGNGERRVGFWTPDRGIIRELSASSELMHSASTKELKKVVWPGDSVTQPKVGTIPAPKSIRVGVPWKPGFKEFVDVKMDPETKETHAYGFVIEIFREALKWLNHPFNYTFHCYNGSNSADWTYDSMLEMIPKEYDMVVGDTTIWAPRALYVDFSLPYSEPGVVLVVKNKKPFDMWIFIKPLRWDLWLAIIVACIFMGIVLRILERRVATAEQSGVIYWSPIAVLAFPERDMVSNKWSVFVVICWLFMAFILMQSFTANLSAILTLDQLQFSFSQDHYVGYHEASFMRKFLIEKLHISESRLRAYASVEGYHEAMCKGSKNGGIDAIFDELPYMRLLVKYYESEYKIVGPTYRTDGLGFAFPTMSPLAAQFSRAILNVTQGPIMNDLERQFFGPGYSSQDPLSSVISQGTSSLTLREFAGLFLLTGSLIIFALFCSETRTGQKLTGIVGHFVENGFSFRNLRVHSMERASANTPHPTRDIQLTRNEAEQDDDNGDDDNMAMDNDTDVAQDAGGRIDNQGSGNS